MKAIPVEDLRAIWSATKRSGLRDFELITVMALGLGVGESLQCSCGMLGLSVCIDALQLELKSCGRSIWRK